MLLLQLFAATVHVQLLAPKHVLLQTPGGTTQPVAAGICAQVFPPA